ncbi:MAG: helix-turn-helix transcriptional regulator [Ruminococcaceae bacterium]|nr:helix-turn-helix transcriptional regulator [Oscillospiraceae bacterium]
MIPIEIYSTCKLRFAHTYKADNYYNNLRSEKNFMEISYISDGHAVFETQDGLYPVQKGDVICLLENAKITANSFHAHHTVRVSVDWDYTDNPQCLFLPFITKKDYQTDNIISLIDDIIFYSSLYESSQAKCTKKFLEILCEIDNCNRLSNNIKLSEPTLYAEKAKKYIDKNIHKALTQKEIANHLCITPEYLCNIFKASQNITIMKYINKTKLENIANLIESEHIPLYKAAAMYGFSDANYVSRLYKKIFGHNITKKSTNHTLQ